MDYIGDFAKNRMTSQKRDQQQTRFIWSYSKLFNTFFSKYFGFRSGKYRLGFFSHICGNYMKKITSKSHQNKEVLISFWCKMWWHLDILVYQWLIWLWTTIGNARVTIICTYVKPTTISCSNKIFMSFILKFRQKIFMIFSWNECLFCFLV